MTLENVSPPERGRLPSLRWMALSTCLVLAAYTGVIFIARGGGLLQSLMGGLANTIPVIVLGLMARSLIIRHLVGRSPLRTGLGHMILALLFVVLAYWLLLVLLGLINGVSATEFDVRPFDPRAMAWQSLQNLTTYGLVAALTHLQARGAAQPVVLAEPGTIETGRGGPSRYFIRSGEDIRPIEVADIVSIAGADDYAEVKTISGRHLVRMTLAEFEAALDADRFARVHRSHIVSLDRIVRAEPAGNGRLLLHMEDGELIQTSRAGSRRVRDRVL